MFRMRTAALPVILIIALGGGLAAFAEDPMVSKAKEFIELMAGGDFNGAFNRLDSNLGFKLKDGSKLRTAWSGLESKAGPFKEFRDSSVQLKQGGGLTYVIVTQVTKFDKGLVDLIVALDMSGRIADFQFTNHEGQEPPPNNDSGEAPSGGGNAESKGDKETDGRNGG